MSVRQFQNPKVFSKEKGSRLLKENPFWVFYQVAEVVKSIKYIPSSDETRRWDIFQKWLLGEDVEILPISLSPVYPIPNETQKIWNSLDSLWKELFNVKNSDPFKDQYTISGLIDPNIHFHEEVFSPEDFSDIKLGDSQIVIADDQVSIEVPTFQREKLANYLFQVPQIRSLVVARQAGSMLLPIMSRLSVFHENKLSFELLTDLLHEIETTSQKGPNFISEKLLEGLNFVDYFDFEMSYTNRLRMSLGMSLLVFDDDWNIHQFKRLYLSEKETKSLTEQEKKFLTMETRRLYEKISESKKIELESWIEEQKGLTSENDEFNLEDSNTHDVTKSN